MYVKFNFLKFKCHELDRFKKKICNTDKLGVDMWKEFSSINEEKWAVVSFCWQVTLFGSQCYKKCVHSIRTVALFLKILGFQPLQNLSNSSVKDVKKNLSKSVKIKWANKHEDSRERPQKRLKTSKGAEQRQLVKGTDWLQNLRSYCNPWLLNKTWYFNDRVPNLLFLPSD